MGLIPGRKQSKKQKAGRAAHKVPKPSGKVLKAAVLAIVGAVTFKAIRSKTAKQEAPPPAPAPASAQPAADAGLNGTAPQAEPAAASEPAAAAETTKPEGDEVKEEASEES